MGNVRRHWLPLAGIAGLVVAVDQTAKALVRARLPYGDEARVLGVRLHHTHNDGLLGGFVSGAAVPVAIITVAVIAAGLVAYARRPAMAPGMRVAAALLLGGAIGNLVDRLRQGYVTDFIARGDVNAFNLADLAIYAGLGGYVLISLVRDRRASREG